MKLLNRFVLLLCIGLYVTPQILRGQSFNPSALNNLALWLRADTAVTLTAGTVSQWGDISGNNLNAAQNTAGSRPAMVTSPVICSQPAIRFDGTNDFLTGPLIAGLNNSCSIFILFQGNATSNTGSKGLFTAGTQSAGFWLNHGNNVLTIRNNNGALPLQSAFPISGFPFTLLEVVKDQNTALNVYRNGVQDTFSTNSVLTGTFTNSAYQLGFSSGYLKGEIAEVIIYTRALSAAERQQVEAYLATRYVCPLNLGADINEPYRLCPVTLRAGNNFTGYLWSTGEVSDSIIVRSSGSYSVTVTDVFGHTVSDTIQVNLPSAALLQNDTTICRGSGISLFTGLTSAGGYNFLWNNGSTGESILAQQAGNYYVIVSDTNTVACSLTSDTLLLALDYFVDTVSLGADTVLCAGNLLGLAVPGTGWGALQFAWSTGSNGQVIPVTTTADYSLTVTNARGCQGVDTINVNVAGNAPTVSFTGNTLCLGDVYDPQNNSQSTDTSSLAAFSWNFGNGDTSSLPNPQYSYTVAGNYTVTLTVTTTAGCSNTATRQVSVLPVPVAAFQTSIACAQNAYQFADQSIPPAGGSINNWLWDFGDSFSAIIQNPQHVYTAAGSYTVTLTVSGTNGCIASTSNVLQVVSTYNTPAAVNIIGPADNSSLESTNVTFSWLPSQFATRYTLLLATNSQFLSPQVYSNLTATTLNLALAGNQTYYWKVRAYNICNDSVESAMFVFTIFSPSNLPRIALWLKGDTGVVLTGGAVSQWNDFSGNNVHAQQQSVTSRPTVVPSALINHKNALRFDGSNDFVTGIGSVPGIADSSLSMFILLSGGTTTNVGAKGVFAAGNQASGFWINHGNGLMTIRNNNAAYSWRSAFPISGFPFRLIEVVKHYNTDLILYQNGVQDTSSTSAQLAGPFVNAAYQVGFTSGYYKGDIAEIIIYSKALNNTDRQHIEQYIYDKYAPPVKLGPDIHEAYKICPVILDAGDRYVNYLWSTGDTVSSITLKLGGQYWVQVTDVFGRISSDTINVSIPYLGISTPDTVICALTSINISPLLASGPYSFQWSNGDVTPSVAVTVPGTYTVTITDTTGCQFVAPGVTVGVDYFGTTPLLPADTSICIGNSLGLDTNIYHVQSTLWSNGQTAPVIPVTGSGSYTVTFTDVYGCTAFDTVAVTAPWTAPGIDFSFAGICLGDTVILTDLTATVPPDGIRSWTWNFDDGQFSTQQNPVHAYNFTGSYNVSLTVLTDSGCSGFIQKPVNILDKPVADFTYSLAICAGTSAVFIDRSNAAPGDTIAQWQWVFNDTDVVNAQVPSYFFPAQGDAEVKLVVTSNNGCTDTAAKKVEVFPPLEADFSFTGTCQGQATQFTDLTGSLSVVNWLWSFGDFNYSSTPNTTHIYNNAGTYSVNLQVTNAIGCVSQITKNVTIVQKPAANFTSAATCLGAIYSPQDSSISITEPITHWQWNIDGINFNGQNPQYVFPDTGIYSVKLKVTTQSGCVDSVVKSFNVTPNPVAAFSFSPQYGEAPLNVTFTNQSTGAANYTWNFGDGSTINTGNAPQQHLFAANDTFIVTLTAVSAAGCAANASKVLVVIPTSLDLAVEKVVAVQTQQPDGSYLVAVKATLANLNSRTITAAKFYLSLGGGNFISESWSGTLTMGQTTDYVFAAQFVVPGEKANTYLCVKAVSVNQDETEVTTENNSQCASLSENVQLLGPLPNPTMGTSLLGIIMPKTGEVTIDIMDMYGHYVQKGVVINLPKGRSDYELPSLNLQGGEYFIRVKHNDNSYTKKLVVAK